MKVLKVFTNIIQQYQNALQQIYDKDKEKLPSSFLIAQCNNFFTFYELLEDMIAPVIDLGIATEEEIDANFNQRLIFLQFQKMQSNLLMRLIQKLFS